VVSLVERPRQGQVGVVLAREQARGLELERQRRQRVREHVVHLTRKPPPLGRRGRARLGCLRGLERGVLVARLAHQPHDEEPRNSAQQDRRRTAATATGQSDGADRDQRDREHRHGRDPFEPHRGHDPDKVRTGLPDAVRLHGREDRRARGHGQQRRDPPPRVERGASRLGRDHAGDEHDAGREHRQPATLEPGPGPRGSRRDDEQHQVREAQAAQEDRLGRCALPGGERAPREPGDA
jgi:hypothetical protein